MPKAMATMTRPPTVAVASIRFRCVFVICLLQMKLPEWHFVRRTRMRRVEMSLSSDVKALDQGPDTGRSAHAHRLDANPVHVLPVRQPSALDHFDREANRQIETAARLDHALDINLHPELVGDNLHKIL